MMHFSIASRLCYSGAITTSNPRVCLVGLALLGLLLQLRPVQGQFQRESFCTIDPRPVLVGLTSFPDYNWFGRHTSLSQNGTIAAIGAPLYGDDINGYVQVVRFDNNSWTQLGSTIIGAAFTGTSTNALSDDGSVLAVGGISTRSIRVFRLVDDDWEPLGNKISTPSEEEFGRGALAISGDGTILAASDNIGDVVQVFELVGGAWSQKGRTLQGQGEELFFGSSISLSQDGSRLAIGTDGFVRVFEFIDNDWVQIGQTLERTNFGESFGNHVSLSSDGRTLAVGAPRDSKSSASLGSVNVYRFGSDGQWIEPGSMLIGNSDDNYFGGSLGLSGDASILVASSSGILRFFEANGDGWIEVGEEVANSTDWKYATISRDGSTAMGGANVFDISCPQGATPDTASPVLSPPTPTMPAQVIANPTVPSQTTTPAGAKASPTSAPGTIPTACTMVQATFSDISLSFNGVTEMSQPETETFERLTKEWYETFFLERSGRVLQFWLLDARTMQTTIEVTDQQLSASPVESSPVNKITYKQTITYTTESNNVDANDYITLPFVNIAANTEYGEILKTELDAFKGLLSPGPVPQFETDTDASGDENTNASGNENGGKSGLIGFIVVASIVGAVLLVLLGIRVNKR